MAKNWRSVVEYVAEVSLTASRDGLSSCQEYPWRVAKKAQRQWALGLDCSGQATRCPFQFVVVGTEALGAHKKPYRDSAKTDGSTLIQPLP